MNTSGTDTLEKSLNAYLRKLARRRSSGAVTADDVVKFLANKGIRLNASARGALARRVLNSNGFINSGWKTASSRPEARGRLIAEYWLNY